MAPEPSPARLSDVLGRLMRRSGVGARTLSKLTGIPRTAIDNWREGAVRRPRHWRPLTQIARVLSLSVAETDELLAAGGHPSIGDLFGSLPAGHPDVAFLLPWRSAESPAPRHQLRAPAADFVGRHGSVNRLLGALGNGRVDAAGISGVRGMGGVGKTELALVVANRLRAAYPDAQVFLNLAGATSSPASPGQALRQVINVFAPDAQLPGDLDGLRRHYCAVLAGQRVLVVADDARDAGQVRPLMPPPGSALLVTSRRRFTVPGMLVVDLDEMSESEAVALLAAVCDRLHPEDARAIARACGYLPLAVRTAASVLANDPALPVAEYLARLGDERHRLEYLRDPDDPELDVAASLALSYARLDDTAQSTFRQIGVLVADFTADLAGKVHAAQDADVGATLHRLLRYNMVRYDPVHDRWSLHDLVRDLARERLATHREWEPTMRRYADAAIALAEDIRAMYETGGDSMSAALAWFDLERPHIDAARAWATEHAGDPLADRLLVAECVAMYRIGLLRYDLGSQVRPQSDQALAAARRLGDRHGEASILNRLGWLHNELGDLEASTGFFTRQLEVARTLGEPSEQISALNNLAAAYSDQGQLREAMRLHEEQLPLVRALGDARAEAKALCNIGGLRAWLGDWRQGQDDLRRALGLARSLGDRYGESLVLNNLAGAYVLHGDALRAVECLERALVIARAMGNRHSEGAILSTWAHAAASGGDARAAIDHAEAALSIARDIGARHSEANALQALGQGHAAAGDLPAARPAFERAMAIFTALDDRRGVAECQWQFGLAIGDEEPTRALSLLRAALDYQRTIGHVRVGEFAALVADRERAWRRPD